MESIKWRSGTQLRGLDVIRSEIFIFIKATAYEVNITVLYDVTPCRLVNSYG
jgi:hypothetical protein